MIKILEKYNIKQPRLYDMQFAHNNCKAKCVKAGQGHFGNLLRKDEATFKQLMEQEIVISDYIRYTKQPAVKKDLQKDYMFAEVWEYVTTGKKTAKIQHLINTHKLLQKLEFWCQFKRRGNNQTIHIYEKYVPC